MGLVYVGAARLHCSGKVGGLCTHFFSVLLIVTTFWGCPNSAHSDELRIASWNIANLAEPGNSFRAQKRSEDDYVQLRKKISELKPHIIALQEMGSIAAAERILGKEYEVQFESRCYKNAHKCTASIGDIYTAIAFHKELVGATFFQVDSLAVNHTDECRRSNKVRGGVGVKIDIGGRQTWILSVHMKAACKHDFNPDPDVQDDCEAQQRQFEALKDWMKERTNDAIIVAGDLNRLLLNEKDRIRRTIFNSLGKSVRFLPTKNSRQCWLSYPFDKAALVAEARQNNPEFDANNITPQIYLPTSQNESDMFVIINEPLNVQFAGEQVEMRGLYRFERPGETLKTCQDTIKITNQKKRQALTFGQAYPSDHCPILLKLSY
jgi:endonuclease/exonuclease/phosphatase family metal-dependent hydrolase